MSLKGDQLKALTTAGSGGGTRDLTPYVSAFYNGAPVSVGNYMTLPRDEAVYSSGSYGPSTPPPIQPVDQPQGGAIIPRRWQAPVGYNLPTGPGATKLVDFKTLQNLADIDPITRKCIAVRAAEIAQLGWEITSKDPRESEKYNGQIAEIEQFFKMPDPIRGLEMDSWLKVLVEEVLVKDALSIYPHETWRTGQGHAGSSLHALEILDGATVKPLVDYRGARPEPPNPAYQQYMYGVPRAEMMGDITGGDADPNAVKAFTRNQLYYRLYNPRSNTMYGFPNVEQIILTVNLSLKRLQGHTAYFTEGSIPAGLLHVPEEWDASEVREFEENWNAVLSGDIAWKYKVRAVPGGTGWTELKPMVFDTVFDEWLARLTCIGMDVTPEEIGLNPKSGLGGAGWGAQQENILYRKSLRPLTSWIAELFNQILAVWFKAPQLEFRFQAFEVEDEQKKASIDQILISTGIKTQNEARVERGMEPWPEQLGSLPMLIMRTGPILLEDVDAMSKVTTGKVVPLTPDQPMQVTATQQDDQESAKAADLRRWQDKATKAVRAGRSPLVPFQSEAISPVVAGAIKTHLAKAASVEDVRRAFPEALKAADEGLVVHNHITMPEINMPAYPAMEVHNHIPDQPAPVFHNHMPEVKIPESRVTVNVPEQQPPTVNITTPDIHVPPADIKVSLTPPPPADIEVIRDTKGNVHRIHRVER